MKSLLFFIFIPCICGFLLDTNNQQIQGQTVGNQQFLTVSEFFDSKTHLENGISLLRHDTDSKLKLLSTQVQQMMLSLQSAIIQNITGSGALTSGALELKYNNLMDNYTKLQTRFDELEKTNIKQGLLLSKVKNRSVELEKEISDLKGLKSVQNMMDTRALENQVQQISSNLHSINFQEQARGQDFQALYAAVTNLKTNVDTKDANQTLINLQLVQTIQDLDYRNNATFSGVSDMYSDLKNETGRINTRIDQLEKSSNKSLEVLKQKVASNSKKVGITSCVNSDHGTKPAGHIITFDDVRTQINVNNVSGFKSSGKFTCEVEGVYIVSAWVLSQTADSEFSIYKNGILIAYAFIRSNGDGYDTTATSVVVVDLQKNDNVWVQTRSQMRVYNGRRCCLTIVKVR